MMMKATEWYRLSRTVELSGTERKWMEPKTEVDGTERNILGVDGTEWNQMELDGSEPNRIKNRMDRIKTHGTKMEQNGSELNGM